MAVGEFDGEHVLVTGGTNGIGRAAAEQFASGGAHVTVWGRNPDRLREMNARDRITAEAVDVTNAAEVYQAMGRVAGQDSIDVVVHAAASPRPQLEPDLSYEESVDEWNEIIGNVLGGTLHVTQAALRHMRRGSLVLVSSQLATDVSDRLGAYASPAYITAKAGVEGMARALAIIHGKSGIRVNAVAPGFTLGTGMTYGLEDVGALYQDMSATGQIATVDQVASGITYLASDRAGGITGQVLQVNAGAHAG